MRETVISIRHHGCPLSDTSAANPGVHIQNLSKGKRADGRAKRLICLRGRPPEIAAFAADFRAHDSVVRFDRIAGDEGSATAYFSSEIEYDSENPSILSRIHKKGCFQHTTVSVKRGREHWKIYTEDTGTVHELTEELESLGNDVTLYQTTEMGSLGETQSFGFATFLTELTARQQAAFETALALGYYESGSDVTTEDIASELDLNQSTVWEHLKKAENTILTTVGKQLFPENGAAGETAVSTEP